MNNQGIAEADWKRFRRLRELALDRFCRRVLDKAQELIDRDTLSHHQRYLALFRFLKERDDELADAFNSPKRSTALIQLARLRYHDLLTDEEFAEFSPETQSIVALYLEL
jgi:peptide subunit release factor 1 (eRF1)